MFKIFLTPNEVSKFTKVKQSDAFHYVCNHADCGAKILKYDETAKFLEKKKEVTNAMTQTWALYDGTEPL